MFSVLEDEFANFELRVLQITDDVQLSPPVRK